MAKSKTDLEKDLCKAAHAGDIEKVRSLIKQGVNVNAHQTPAKFTIGMNNAALYNAVEKGDIPLTELLLASKADVNMLSGKSNDIALQAAIEKCNIPLIKLLLNAKANVNVESGSKLAASLYHGVISHNSTAIVPLLLKAGAAIDSRDSEGNTPLLTILGAAEYVDKASLVCLLLGEEPKPDVNAKNNQGYTPLHLALSLGLKEEHSPKICSLLVQRGALIDSRNDLNKAPLHFLESPEYKKIKQEARVKKAAGQFVNARRHFEALQKLREIQRERIEKTMPFFNPGYLILLANLIEQEHLINHPEDHLLILLNKDTKVLDETINNVLHKAREVIFKAHQEELKLASEALKMPVEELKNYIFTTISDSLKTLYLGERYEAFFWQPYIEMLLEESLNIRENSISAPLAMEILKYNIFIYKQPLGFVKDIQSPFSTEGGERVFIELIKNRIGWLLKHLEKVAKADVKPPADRGDSKQSLDLAQAQRLEKLSPEPVSEDNILWLWRFAKSPEEPIKESKKGKELREQEREREPKEKKQDQKP